MWPNLGPLALESDTLPTVPGSLNVPLCKNNGKEGVSIHLKESNSAPDKKG